MSSASDASETATFESVEAGIRALRDKKRMGDAFEHIVAHFLRRDPTVGCADVWPWDDWPDLIRLGLKSDQGIDIVATDGEGKRVAVQVKFHSDPDLDVTQREVATLSLQPDLCDRWVIISNAIGHARRRSGPPLAVVTSLGSTTSTSSTAPPTGAVRSMPSAARPSRRARGGIPANPNG